MAGGPGTEPCVTREFWPHHLDARGGGYRLVPALSTQ